MIIQRNDQNQFNQQAWRIKTQTATILKKWGLLPRFKRWRLTQDPDTGMIVLFGILNNQYIASQTSIPFNNYFDPRLLQDLTTELEVQVISCNSDGLRYAFILDRGQLGKLPTHIETPLIDDKLLIRVVYADAPQTPPDPPADMGVLDDHALVHEGVGAFLKVFDDINLRDHGTLQPSEQKLPDIVVITPEEFHQRVTELEADFQRSNRIRQLLGRMSD